MAKKLIGSAALTPSSDTGFDLTTKGDTHGFSDQNARIPISTNNFSLLCDSAESLGLKWAASPTSVLSGAQDILYSSAANTLARLAAGTDGDLLTTHGTGSAPTWETPSAGGGGQMVLVDHTELASDATEIDTTFTAINGTDVSCLLIYVNAATDAINEIRMQFNGMTSAYYTDGYVVTTGSASFTNDNNLGYARLASASGTDRMTPIAVIEYTGDSTFTSTAAKKIAYLINGHMATGTSWWNNGENDAEDITTFDQVRLYVASGNLRAGTSLDIYRVNKT